MAEDFSGKAKEISIAAEQLETAPQSCCFSPRACHSIPRACHSIPCACHSEEERRGIYFQFGEKNRRYETSQSLDSSSSLLGMTGARVEMTARGVRMTARGVGQRSSFFNRDSQFFPRAPIPWRAWIRASRAIEERLPSVHARSAGTLQSQFGDSPSRSSVSKTDDAR